MGLFHICLEDTKEALIKNMKDNIELLNKNPDLNYLITFIEVDIKKIKQLIEDKDER